MPPVDSDAEAYRRWADGDPSAGAQLVDRYFDAIARFFRSKTSGGIHVQDDLVQATFTACVEARERFRGDGSFRSFLFSIAYNTLRRHYERSRREEQIDFGTVSIHDLAPGPSSVAAARAEQALLVESLRRLPVELQTALELFYWESMTAAEIGEALGLPTGTVKTRLRRARELLREDVENTDAAAGVRRAALAAFED